jgi:hypothetical protein
MSISLLSVARHKHPLVQYSLVSLFVQNFGPNRTIDIQDQNAHIKGEHYKSF